MLVKMLVKIASLSLEIAQKSTFYQAIQNNTNRHRICYNNQSVCKLLVMRYLRV